MTDSEELGRLAALHERGALSDEEFARAKARVLGGDAAADAAPHTAYSAASPAASSLTGLGRSLHDRWLGGVCGGFARFTDTPAWLWRFGFALLCFFSAGAVVFLYVLLWILMPLDPVIYAGAAPYSSPR